MFAILVAYMIYQNLLLRPLSLTLLLLNLYKTRGWVEDFRKISLRWPKPGFYVLKLICFKHFIYIKKTFVFLYILRRFIFFLRAKFLFMQLPNPLQCQDLLHGFKLIRTCEAINSTTTIIILYISRYYVYVNYVNLKGDVET